MLQDAAKIHLSGHLVSLRRVCRDPTPQEHAHCSTFRSMHARICTCSYQHVHVHHCCRRVAIRCCGLGVLWHHSQSISQFIPCPTFPGFHALEINIYRMLGARRPLEAAEGLLAAYHSMYVTSDLLYMEGGVCQGRVRCREL